MSSRKNFTVSQRASRMGKRSCFHPTSTVAWVGQKFEEFENGQVRLVTGTCGLARGGRGFFLLLLLLSMVLLVGVVVVSPRNTKNPQNILYTHLRRRR